MVPFRPIPTGILGSSIQCFLGPGPEDIAGELGDGDEGNIPLRASRKVGGGVGAKAPTARHQSFFCLFKESIFYFFVFLVMYIRSLSPSAVCALKQLGLRAY